MTYRDDPLESVWEDVGDAEEAEPKWIIKNLLPAGVTFLNGPPKSYKSTTELAMMLSVIGVDHTVLPADLCEVPETGNVMGMSLEASAGVLKHTAKQGFGVEIPADGSFRVMSDPWMFRLDQPADADELLGWIDRVKPKVFLIDPLRNAHSLDENDSGGMVKMLQKFQQYAVKHDMSVLIVHHSKKISDEKGSERMAKANDMRGSSALFGMADAVLTQTAKGKGLIHIDAVFKRGEAWQRTIQLGIWGATAVESIDSLTKAVHEKLSAGATYATVADDLHISKTKVSQCVAVLKRIGALTAEGVPTEHGSSIVSSAVRKYAPST